MMSAKPCLPSAASNPSNQASRGTSPWEHDLAGLYAGKNVVAEMKRTDRDKDWPFITSLGNEMLRARDQRGWLHLFEPDALLECQDEDSIPSELFSSRPLLQLAINRDPRLRMAVMAERHFWQELDRLRIRIYRAALRPYVLAMGRARISSGLALPEQHRERVACAEKSLAQTPIASYGVDRLIAEARAATAAFVQPELLEWLPNVRPYFTFLEL